MVPVRTASTIGQLRQGAGREFFPQAICELGASVFLGESGEVLHEHLTVTLVLDAGRPEGHRFPTTLSASHPAERAAAVGGQQEVRATGRRA